MNEAKWKIDTDRVTQVTADAIFFAEVNDFDAEDSEVNGNAVTYFDETGDTLTITIFLSGVKIARSTDNE